MLRDWEESHMNYLSFLYQSLQGDHDLMSYERFSKTVPASHTESGIPVTEAVEIFERKDVHSDEEALNIALEIEGKAYNLYRKLSESARDSNAQVIFKEMMSQEKKHIDRLMNLKGSQSGQK
jgi:rubrerythrin